jgi:hypothetical protein
MIIIESYIHARQTYFMGFQNVLKIVAQPGDYLFEKLRDCWTLFEKFDQEYNIAVQGLYI